MDIAAIDAAVTDKLANTGVIVSTNASESSGLACLGTTQCSARQYIVSFKWHEG